MKKILLLSTTILLSNLLLAGTFDSNVATGNYNVAATWILTGGTDADGIPDADDDITILAGHDITISTTSGAKDVTVQGILRGGSTMVFSIKFTCASSLPINSWNVFLGMLTSVIIHSLFG